MSYALSAKALSEFKDHVIACYPEEACGFVIGDEFHPVKNSSPEPLTTFHVAPIDYVKAEALGVIQAFLHSHPYSKFDPPKWPSEWPSAHDMRYWMDGTIPWGIVGTDGEGLTDMVWLDDSLPPLVGRDFVHGVRDCYGLIRDWFRVNKQIDIPNFARSMEWWFTGEDLYEKNFAEVGFAPIDLKDAVIGDCVMMKVASPVTNHAAVITGPNEILHHMFHRLSGADRLDKWKRHIVRAVRYVGRPNEKNSPLP